MIVASGNNFHFLPYENGSLLQTLPAGIYQYKRATSQNPAYMEAFSPMRERPVQLDGEMFEAVREEVALFFTPAFRKSTEAAGQTHKMGILLYGPPGTGKTHLVWALSDFMISRNTAIIVNTEPHRDMDDAINLCRHNAPDRPIAMVWESFVLELLDGARSKSNVIAFAMTNFIDRIPERIYDRPSRFRLVQHISEPNESQRRQFCKGMYPEITESDMDFLITLTAGMSLDHLKQYAAMLLRENKSRRSVSSRVRGLIKTRIQAVQDQMDKPGMLERDLTQLKGQMDRLEKEDTFMF